MVVNERKLLRLLGYKTVFFPDERTVENLTTIVRSASLTRLFWVDRLLKERRLVINHKQSLTVLIALDSSVDQLWSGIAKTGRNIIRNAQRLGDRIEILRNTPEGRHDFLDLYAAFAAAKSGVARFRSDLIDRYGPHTDIFVCKLDGQVLCGHAYLRDESLGRARLLYSASRRLEGELAKACGNLNRLLHWEEILTYRQDGFRSLDFGGIRDDSNDGIAKFKCSFGGEKIEEHTYLFSRSPVLSAVLRRLLHSAQRSGESARDSLIGRLTSGDEGSHKGSEARSA